MGEPTGLSNEEANAACFPQDPATEVNSKTSVICTHRVPKTGVVDKFLSGKVRDFYFTNGPTQMKKDFIFQQTMYRIKDPKKSLEFYTKVLGMHLLQKLDFPEMKFSLYFMGFENTQDIPTEKKERLEWTFSRKATLELTHNWGSETNNEFSYHNGNDNPRGFGHIGIMVPDVNAACERFERLGVEFVKKPLDGKIKGIAFIKDPDGYWIEILNNKIMSGFVNL